MKYCPNCGAEAKDEAKFCEYCGHKFENVNQNNYINQAPNNNTNVYNSNVYKNDEPYESTAVGVCAIIFAFLFPIIGLILSIVALTTKKSQTNKTLGLIGILISIVSMIINFYLYYSVLIS